jgi:hypothetical protein
VGSLTRPSAQSARPRSGALLLWRPTRPAQQGPSASKAAAPAPGRKGRRRFPPQAVQGERDRSFPWTRSFPWSFRHALHRVTGPYLLDDPTDLTSKDHTMRDAMDGGGSTCSLLLGVIGARSFPLRLQVPGRWAGRATSGLPAWPQALLRRCSPRERSCQRESDGTVSWLRRRPPRSRAASPDWLRISRSRSRSGRRATIAVIRASTPTR